MNSGALDLAGLGWSPGTAFRELCDLDSPPHLSGPPPAIKLADPGCENRVGQGVRPSGRPSLAVELSAPWLSLSPSSFLFSSGSI